ncbi:protein kinase domain-containing protein [Pyxidicoccus xibeiensis]|uniref:protein kinase domain-containing protein n=1 Tax=Pyxidicoccus xibeiensis TaxID=2906759 RepID=UPI0020A7DE7E|nr:protein kinase [Pyxidicoccus xibeiensis]MCP3137056.1 protein kinase [Pyxidicoccus xibeiensis]
MSGTTLPLAPETRTLGKYEVLCRLSTGGMAEIFLASQRGLAGFRKLVVLKQILPDIRGEEEFVRMFLDEAKVTAAFNHPHIAQVYDLDIADGELFLSMEFVPGATLVEVARACRQAHHPIPLGYSLMAVRDTAVALHYAHTFTDPLGHPSPVIHRDVAEKNIMVTYEGVTKLLDFGIAKSLARASRTAVGMVKGTSGYMSPEQIMGEPLDARSDLFSLGVVLHECLTGMRLFYAKQAEAMMNAVLKCDVTPPSRTNKLVPPELDAIVMRALARRREDRYATTLEFARALERAVGPLIWHPEQSSELMRRLFSDRREQTRQLLASGQAADTTNELSVARVLAMGSEASVAVPTVKPPAQGKPVTPPHGSPSPRRATTGVPTPPPSAASDEGPLRKPGVQGPPQKRVATRPPSGEGPRPPAEARTPPPPPSEPAQESAARTQPNRSALQSQDPSFRTTQPSTQQLSQELLARAGSRAASDAEEAPRGEPRPRTGRSTLEGMRTVAPPETAARTAAEESRVRGPRTNDHLRITAPLPPPSERDLQTAMMRPPSDPERDLQTAMVRTPVAPDRDAQGARASASSSERDAQQGRGSASSVDRDVQQGRGSASSSEREAQMGRGSASSAERDAQPARTSTPPPAERDLQTAMVRMPSAERDAQPARTSTPPPAERDLQTAMVRMPSAERDAQPARTSTPPSEREPRAAIPRTSTPATERDSQKPAPRPQRPPPEHPDETLSVTPPHTPRRGGTSRRRPPLPPSVFTESEARTQPVLASIPEDDEDLGDDDAENTQGGRRQRRNRVWGALAGVLLLVGVGAGAVLLGLDGGLISSRLGPGLARFSLRPKPGTPAPAPVNTEPVAAVAAGPGEGPPANPGPVAAATDTAESKAGPPTDSLRPAAEPPGTAPSNPEPTARADAPSDESETATADAESPAAAEASAASSKKSRTVAKRAQPATKKSRTTEGAAAGSAAEGSSEGTPAVEPGFLTLVTEPSAKVFVGGRELGATPLFKVKLPSGKHALKLVDGEGKAMRLSVDIKPGETTAVRTPLAMLSDQ